MVFLCESVPTGNSVSLSCIALLEFFPVSLILGEQEDCHGDCSSSYDPYGPC